MAAWIISGAALIVGSGTSFWGIVRNSQTPMPVGPVPVIGGGVFAFAGLVGLIFLVARTVR